MRVLLDECLPRRLSRELIGHHVETVPQAGWAGKKNGDLLRLAAESFDVFLTIDASVGPQNNLKGLAIAVITLAAPSNRLEDLRPHMPRVLEFADHPTATRQHHSRDIDPSSPLRCFCPAGERAGLQFVAGSRGRIG
jgi:hypothetical protein